MGTMLEERIHSVDMAVGSGEVELEEPSMG
jgi:hypothetical protein